MAIVTSYNDSYKGQQEVLPMAISTSPQQTIYPEVQQTKRGGEWAKCLGN